MRAWVVTCSFLFALLLLPNRAFAQRYELADGSQLFEGCVGGLCLCPIRINSKLLGQMAVVDAGNEQFKILDARWEGMTFSKPVVFEGNGFYQRRDAGELREHRLQMTLSANGEDPVEYDSGWMQLVDESANIAISIAPPPETCYGYAFAVVAQPRSTANTESRSWATVKDRW